MHTLLLLLAISGGAAVLARLGRNLFQLAHGGVDALFASNLVKTRAERGDITGLQDAHSVRAGAVRRRQLALAALAFWVGLLLLPPLTPWPALIYAAYSVLWLFPRARSPRA